MSWTDILQIDPGEHVSLGERIGALFQQQRATWPALRDGEAALAGMQRKTLNLHGDSVVVQVNPARRRSTQAQTDASAVAARPCFLCPQNMPAEERGIAFEELVVLPNPFPVLPLHTTIAAREHRPQRIADQVGKMLRLAKEIGGETTAILYNGPRCGASAPDHFHFQSASAVDIPLLNEIPSVINGIAARETFGRKMLICSGPDESVVQAAVERVIAALQKLDPSSQEPMLNIMASYRDGCYVVVVFPRAAHRPACYFATGPDKLAVSPAILEMCGVFVTTELDDFARVDAATACAIYEEVCISRDRFENVKTRLKIKSVD
jgi:hypothetical protein